MWIPSTSLAVRAPVTSNDKSTAITIATWTLMSIFVMMFLSRCVIKFVVFRKFGYDDLLILVATILGIGLSATILVLAAEGLGILGQLTVPRAELLMKAYYASDLLYISSLCFAKVSLIAYFYNLFVQRIQRRIVLGLGIFIALWTIASLAAVAFQCTLPRPWASWSLSCYNIGVFWIVYCIIDMTTDVAIIMLSVNLVAYLKVKFSRKAVVVACFAPRILVIGASLTRLIYLYQITPRSNPVFNLWIPIICSQVQVCLAISTACIPYIKPFFEGPEASGRRGDESRRKGTTPFGAKFAYTPANKKGQELYSIDSTVGPTPDVSPRIPTPAPLSPLTPPRYVSPASSNGGSKASSRSSKAASERGLRLYIPGMQHQTSTVTDYVSPQTASSHALSPRFLSPVSARPLISPMKVSPIREPTPPPPAHNPRLPVASSYYGSNASLNSSPNTNNKRSPPRSPNFSLFPSPATGRFVPPNRKPLVQKRFSNQRLPANGSRRNSPQPKHPSRASSMKQRWSGRPGPAIKFAVAPNPTVTSPTTTINSRASKSTPTTQSAGTAPTIPSYYLTTPPPTSASAYPPLPQPPSPQRERNKRILSPSNSSRKDQISPVSPPTPMTFWKEDTSPESESGGINTAETPMRANIPWDIEDMPVIRDIRSSPRIVIRRSS